MNASKHKKPDDSTLVTWGWVTPSSSSTPLTPPPQPTKPRFDLLHPLRQWLDTVEVNDAEFAHKLCKLIPAQCPFERKVQFRGRVLLHIPPLCKLNPVYDEVVALRFRALCYLADVCGEDISLYC